jgi:hypothetical protein
VTGVNHARDFSSNLPQKATYGLPGNIVVGYYRYPLDADNITMEHLECANDMPIGDKHLHCDPNQTTTIITNSEWSAKGGIKFDALGRFVGSMGVGGGVEYEYQYTLDGLSKITMSHDDLQKK